jgi:uncharacterized protein YggE
MTKVRSELEQLYIIALEAVFRFEEAAAHEEVMWTGWGEQTVPPEATTRRVKAGQAFDALRDADKRSKPIIEFIKQRHRAERDLEAYL